jgi:hypothetical protein
MPCTNETACFHSLGRSRARWLLSRRRTASSAPSVGSSYLLSTVVKPVCVSFVSEGKVAFDSHSASMSAECRPLMDPPVGKVRGLLHSIVCDGSRRSCPALACQIFVNPAKLEKLVNDGVVDAPLFSIAHQMAHIALRHSTEMMATKCLLSGVLFPIWVSFRAFLSCSAR